ncbi:fimbrial protein [Morganella morganii]|uniref:fimbrial protein n=1 Tax=Morganella TaxID=581 RepID=UPI001C46B3C0|nr:fimbrial protein [Morganella morganii]QXO74063.1 type 1 fimbrial protein [Morganella morganii]
MKLKHAVLPTALALLFSAASFADNTGTIFFKGKINASTCKVNNGARNIYVNMGTHDASEFANAGDSSIGPEFELKLTECTGKNANVSLLAQNLVAGAEDQIGLKVTPTSATGLVIVLNDKSSNQVRKVDGTEISTQRITGGETTFKYVPRLLRTADPLQPGTINAAVDYTITYN